MPNQENIHIKGARVHNLKNIEVIIPRNQLVVITGLSGSGKSSLAFDTLYAEGQRRYVESLSAYARQFLGRMSKPEVDFIKGLPPAIAIEQRVNNRNPRSTVGTSTEIYEYMKLLYARIGKTYSPISGKEVKRDTTQHVVDKILTYKKGTRLLVLSPMDKKITQPMETLLEAHLHQGYTRVFARGTVQNIQQLLDDQSELATLSSFALLIDRLVVDDTPDGISRLTDSVETAFFEGNGKCLIRLYATEGEEELRFSTTFEEDGICFEVPNEHMFNFNNPLGACPTCNGFGKVIGIDEDLVIPNKNLSIYEDAVLCWRGEVMGKWKKELIYAADKFDFPIHTPYYQLTEKQKDNLWRGNAHFEGIDGFFRFIESNQYKIQYRVMMARYRGKTTCHTCRGSRLKKEATYVKIADTPITQLVQMPITSLVDFFSTITLAPSEEHIGKRLLLEIQNRLHLLLQVGLGYLTLHRLSNTLSGGESQRINLTTSLGSSLVGSMYILDEPSIGLHPRDTQRLIQVLKQLRDIGNTVVVVEHDEEIMRAADYIIDIGKDAGSLGGEVVFQGSLESLLGANTKEINSYTVQYLTGKEKIPLPTQRRKWSNYIEVYHATDNNLKNINVKFPLNVLTVVTGVSGSGKSTLVNQVFYERLKKALDSSPNSHKQSDKIGGSYHLLSSIELIDQQPIGRSSRSNPVTYIKAYDEIRKLYAAQPLSKQMGYTPAYYSFNTSGGRCEECQGEGTVTVEMQFMADVVLPCEYCHGKRFKSDILEVAYREKNIADILDMTIDDAILFFSEKKENNSTEKKIVKRLLALQRVGIGYVKLGQPSSTLSGGESQRVKLGSFLANEKSEPTLFIFDEPTTGLHFHDIKKLLNALNALIEKGHTVLVIEHNPDIIKSADHIIDLGREGGESGGDVVFEGVPEQLIDCTASYTGQYMKSYML